MNKIELIKSRIMESIENSVELEVEEVNELTNSIYINLATSGHLNT